MKILIACEYSGIVRNAFQERGHDATSCDVLPTEIPGKHHQGDVTPLLKQPWDMIIAHPPCTYLTCAAEWAYKDDPGKNMREGVLFGRERREARVKALEFIKQIWEANTPRLCIENPVGVINSRLDFMPKPQWIQPHQFGDNASKTTGLWTRGLPKIEATSNVQPRLVCCKKVIEGKAGCEVCNGQKKPLPRWGNQTDSGQNRLAPSAQRGKVRSLTYRGIAAALATQWG